MKKANLLVLGLVVAMGLSSCIKEGDTFDPAAQYELEKPIIEQYAAANGILDYRDVEGVRVYYELVSNGDPESYQYKTISNPNNPSQPGIEAPDIKVIFSGKLLTGDVVVHENQDDEGDDTSLRNVTAAWVYAFLPREIRYDEDGEPLDEPVKFNGVGGFTTEGLKVGSVIRIVSPSYLLYGDRSSGKIPANSPMYYEIEVVDISAPDTDSN